ncbi:protein-L-isoaspartate O-methyltransferase [Streptomyces sp. 3N207]|uniref:protein-L-isoaspartate O-methyltransferase n=1 Tax=Streptomyces sp. 3N207 TaxID=3457417 RepID=UPI003FD1FDFA
MTGGVASSSLSCCSVVVDMLDSLKLEEGHTVLELGTATGWNAALLASRAGSGRVTSIEMDPELAVGARKNLSAAGAGVAVEVADGGAPWAWVEQTRPGGRIVTPWGRLGHVALTVAEDGTSAQGWIQGLAMFMPSRTAPPPITFVRVRADRPPQHQRTLERDTQALRDDAHLLFALRVALPDVRITPTSAEGTAVLQLHDEDASWATLASSAEGALAWQGGPRRLVDEVETAWDRWIAHGSPELYDYGMTVTDEGRQQYVWAFDAHAGPRWPLMSGRGRADGIQRPGAGAKTAYPLGAAISL